MSRRRFSQLTGTSRPIAFWAAADPAAFEYHRLDLRGGGARCGQPRRDAAFRFGLSPVDGNPNYVGIIRLWKNAGADVVPSSSV